MLSPLSLYAQSIEEVGIFINDWHKAAATANSEAFFGSMADDAVYIGTDKTERWDKKSFQAFAKPYFDKGKAWDFKPYDRQVIISETGNTIWFSELLDTWMGVCRGSGVITKNDQGEMKIRQYHLSVTVPNEIITNFIELVKSTPGGTDKN